MMKPLRPLLCCYGEYNDLCHSAKVQGRSYLRTKQLEVNRVPAQETFD